MKARREGQRIAADERIGGPVPAASLPLGTARYAAPWRSARQTLCGVSGSRSSSTPNSASASQMAFATAAAAGIAPSSYAEGRDRRRDLGVQQLDRRDIARRRCGSRASSRSRAARCRGRSEALRQGRPRDPGRGPREPGPRSVSGSPACRSRGPSRTVRRRTRPSRCRPSPLPQQSRTSTPPGAGRTTPSPRARARRLVEAPGRRWPA